MEKQESSVQWSIIQFKDLSNRQIYDLFELRTEIFVVEQDCPYQEVDQKDLSSYHILAYENDILIALARIIPPKKNGDELSFGRVAVRKEMRGRGLAHELTDRILEFIHFKYPEKQIKISAQTYLIDFYSKHSFRVISEEYLEDDIPHIAMQWVSEEV